MTAEPAPGRYQKGDRGEVDAAETEAAGGAAPVTGGNPPGGNEVGDNLPSGNVPNDNLPNDNDITAQLPVVDPAGVVAAPDPSDSLQGREDTAGGRRRLLSAARQGPVPFLAVAVLLVMTALGAVAVVAVTRGSDPLAPVDPHPPAPTLPQALGGGAGRAGPVPIASGRPSAVSVAPSATMRSPSRAPGVPVVRASSGVPSPARPAPPATAPGTVAPTVWTSLTVNATKALFRGDSVQTNRTRLLMRQDGDLVIIDEHGITRWSSGTAWAGSQATFQADGNFVVYDAMKRALWSSRTDRHDGAVLVLETNGDVCVVDRGTSLWCAGTAH